MVRTMVYLPDELHRAVKHLAVERRTSIAKLVTEALEVLYREDIEDLGVGRERLEAYLKHPEKAVSYSIHRAEKQKRHK
jgi:predicted DNA-binding protein